MKSITQTSYAPTYDGSVQLTFFRKFFAWCTAQERNRFGWLAFSLTAHGCIITPLVVALIGLTGNNLVLWIGAMAAMGIALIVNLAAMPTKITIPTFILSVLIDVAIIATCIVQYAG